MSKVKTKAVLNARVYAMSFYSQKLYVLEKSLNPNLIHCSMLIIRVEMSRDSYLISCLYHSIRIHPFHKSINLKNIFKKKMVLFNSIWRSQMRSTPHCLFFA